LTQSDIKPWLGYLGGATAVAIWAGWISATRFAMTEEVHPLVLAIMRNGLPALLLAPVWLRRGIVPKGASLPAIVMMTLGWGAPFTIFVSLGLTTVPASLFGPLVPGLAALLVAGLAWGLFGARPRIGAVLGLGLMALALSAVLGQWIGEARWAEMQGAPWLLMASLGISIFTIMLPRSGLTPVEGTAYITLYSLPLLVLGLALQPHAFDGLSWGQIGFHALTQGVLTGLIAVYAYGMAVRHLGAMRGSTANALVPVCAALIGMAALGEQPSPIDWVAVTASSLGVAAVNGAFDGLLRRRRAR